MPRFAILILALLLASPATAADKVGKKTVCAIARTVKHEGCSIDLAISFGLQPTGLVPTFPDGVSCRQIDEAWAINYSGKRSGEAYHGGIDIPAPTGTPILAAADGEVVAVFEGRNSYRGKEIVLRHSPAETGLKVWTFTAYSHFSKLPKLKVGDHVHKGDVLGPTGNSGRGREPYLQSDHRRPAIHFAVVYGPSPDFVIKVDTVVPAGARWTDPNAWLAGTVPLDSAKAAALPAARKHVPVGAMLTDGTVLPKGAKRIWPYACTR
jgi:hypothetical protein